MNRGLLSLPLLGWAALSAALAWSGRLEFYLHPTFRPWLLVAAIVLTTIALVLWTTPAAESAPHGRPWRHGPQLLRAFILLLPAAGVAWLDPQGFGARTVMNRGVIKDPALVFQAFRGPLAEDLPLPGQDTVKVNKAEPAELPGFFQFLEQSPDGAWRLEIIDLLYAATEPSWRNALTTVDIELIGQYFTGLPGTESGRFSLIRMLMMCCAADARPLGVWVSHAETPDTPEEMAWVKVKGRVEFPLVEGIRLPIIRASAITPCPPPREWFLFQ